MMKTKITTESGFVAEVNENMIDDAEFFDLLCELDKNPRMTGKVLVYMLGEDGKKELYEHLRNAEGIVPLTAVTQEIIEIFRGLSSKKK